MKQKPHPALYLFVGWLPALLCGVTITYLSSRPSALLPPVKLPYFDVNR